MAILSVDELGEGRSSTTNDERVRTYTRIFRILTDTVDDSTIKIKAAFGLPKLFDKYVTFTENDLSATVNSISVEQEDGEHGKSWKATIGYSTDAEEENEDPTLDPPDVSWSFAQFQTVIEKDIKTDETIKNSAGELFDTPVEKDDSRPILTITRNEEFFDPALAIEYQDTINTDTFFGFDPLQAKVSHISARQNFKNLEDGSVLIFWKVTYVFHFNRDTWIKQILDQGHHFLILNEQDEEVLQEFRLDSGVITETPQLLDGNGKPLDPDDPPFFIPFNVYRELLFAPLGLE